VPKRKLLNLTLAFVSMVLFVLTGVSCDKTEAQYYNDAPLFEPDSVPESALQKAHEISESLEDASLTYLQKSVRNAAVKVARPGNTGHGSGSYLKFKGRHIVITAAHVVEGCETMIVVAGAKKYIGHVVYYDDASDLAILSVPPIKTRVPMPYRVRGDLANKNLIGAKVTYTGFPGRHNLLTIIGTVASLERGHIVVNMYGWFGASGSGVYDEQGRLLGVVSAIDVGNWYMPIPLDSIVWVAPIWKLEEAALRIRLDSHAQSGTSKHKELLDEKTTVQPKDESNGEGTYTLPPMKSFPGAAAPRRGGRRD
tara:strand:+ start:33352 stop:34281 length:930 start_codon:yes stop_codon:yes gene_type:complete